jgi:predicted RNA binding protein YcfA (HicA-like mRNA interferase family)
VAPRLKALSAREVLRALATFGFEVASTRGSHAKLRRVNDAGEAEILTIPLHREVAPGTLRAIYRQACRFVPERELRVWFYR